MKAKLPRHVSYVEFQQTRGFAFKNLNNGKLYPRLKAAVNAR